MKYSLKLILVTLMVLMITETTYTSAGQWVEGKVDSAGGALSYKLWIPGSYHGQSPVPLVMMLHGCTQDPDDFAAGTQMNALADKHNFLVVYPVPTKENKELKCWNWFLPAHQLRGAGEPAKLAAAIESIRAAYKVDPQRNFVVGVSAGAAMAIIMGATYPE